MSERGSTAALSQILGELWSVFTERGRGNSSHTHPLTTRPKSEGIISTNIL